MKTRYTVALSMLAGAALGSAVLQGLHAQAKSPVYTVSEIQITNLDAYLKEFAPVAQASIKAAGGKFLAGGPGTSLEGAPPATRVTIQMWDSRGTTARPPRSRIEIRRSVYGWRRGRRSGLDRRRPC